MTTHPRQTVHACLRVPPPPPAVCEPGVGSCSSIGGDCGPKPRPLPTALELLAAHPEFYARQLTDAQVEALIGVAEHGGFMYPDGPQAEVYARLQGKAGRRPPGFRESRILGRFWDESKIVRPALIEHGPDRWSERRGARAWVLTAIGREVLARFYCSTPKVLVAS